MGDILSSGDYDAVRELVGMDESILPDTVLDEFTFIDLTEATVKAAVSTWAAIMAAGSGSDYVFLRAGTVFRMAALIAQRFEMSIQFGHGFAFGGYSEVAKLVNWQAVREQLDEWAAQAFAGISTYSLTRPAIVVIDGPTSSGANVPSDWEEWIDKIIPRPVDWIEEDGEDD